MFKKTGKKIIAIMIICILLAGGVIGISAAVKKTTGRNNPVMVISAAELNYGSYDDFYYYDEATREGYITSDARQNVTLEDSVAVKKIYVNDGDRVKIGDKILEYDMEKTEIQLGRQEIAKELYERQLKKAKADIEELNKKKPVSENDDEEDGWNGNEDDWGDDEDDSDESQEESETNPMETTIGVKVHTTLNANASAYYDTSTEAEKPGSESNPYRFLCAENKTIKITSDFLTMVKKLKKGSDKARFFEIEIREGDTSSGILKRAWKQNANDIKVIDGWSGTFDENSTMPIIPSDDQAQTDAIQISELKLKIAELEAQITDSETDASTIKQLEEEKEKLQESVNGLNEENESLKNSVEKLEKEIEELKAKQGEDAGSEIILGEETLLSNTTFQKTTFGPYIKTIRKIGSNEIATNKPKINLTVSEDEEYEDEDTGMDTEAQDLNFREEDDGTSIKDTEYTKEELAQAKKEKEQEIKDLEFSIRETKLKIKASKKALKKKVLTATVEGVVKIAESREAANSNGEPYIQISGSSGLSVKSRISESELKDFKVGDKVSVTTWEDSTPYEATITEISEYPDNSSMSGYGVEGYGESYFPFVATIDDQNASLNVHDWVQVAMQKQEEEKEGAFLIDKAFILKDGNTAYVYKRGKDKKLTRQNLKLGKRTGESYEITGGITEEDFIAFPYGKNVKEGAETYEGTFNDLLGEVI